VTADSRSDAERAADYVLDELCCPDAFLSDSRSRTLIARLFLRGLDAEMIRYLFGQAATLPDKWERVGTERPADRAARREALARELERLADALENDPDAGEVTTLDAVALVHSYALAEALRDRALDGIDATPLPQLDADRLAGRPKGARHRVKVQGVLGAGAYPLPTLHEYLRGVAACLRQPDWPDRFDEHERQHVPRKKGARTALRTFCILHVFEVVSELLADADQTRAPNVETAAIVNILLGLRGDDEISAQHVTDARSRDRRRYWTEEE